MGQSKEGGAAGYAGAEALAGLEEVALVVGAIALPAEASHPLARPVEGVHHELLLAAVVVELVLKLHLCALDYALLAGAEVGKDLEVQIQAVLYKQIQTIISIQN